MPDERSVMQSNRRQDVVSVPIVWLMLMLVLGSLPAAAQPYQGFGASTPGGTGQPVYRVTTLNDDGPGSLRDAVSQGRRSIVFDVAGDIVLSNDIAVRGPFLTIDGLTAPPPGITLKNHGVILLGSRGPVHDIIIRGLRIRNSRGCDHGCPTLGGGVLVGQGAYNVVIDRVSIQGSENFTVSVNKGARDVTIQDSIMAENQGKVQLLALIHGGGRSSRGERTQHVTMHHNLFIGGSERMPQVKWSETGEESPDTLLDFRNNLVWNWRNAGTQVWKGAKANVVANYYYAPNAWEARQRRAIFFCHAGSKPPQCRGDRPTLFARAYIADNVSGAGPAITGYLNSLGTESAPFPAPPVQTTDACTAARHVLEKAGVRPLDAIDQKYLGEISLVGCDQRSPSSHR